MIKLVVLTLRRLREYAETAANLIKFKDGSRLLHAIVTHKVRSLQGQEKSDLDSMSFGWEPGKEKIGIGAWLRGLDIESGNILKDNKEQPIKDYEGKDLQGPIDLLTSWDSRAPYHGDESIGQIPVFEALAADAQRSPVVSYKSVRAISVTDPQSSRSSNFES